MSESNSNITPITKRPREPDPAPAQLFERMIALLDQAEDARQARRLQDHDHASDGRAPNDHNVDSICVGISNDDNFVPIISEADWDRAAVEDEDVFRRRFGFAWPHPYRQALIDLKNKRGLSDRGIWWLYHSGSLRRQENGVLFKASWIMAIVGCIAIAALMSQHALVALRIASIPVLTWTQSVVALLLMFGVLAVQGSVYRAFVEPWRIYRRR